MIASWWQRTALIPALRSHTQGDLYKFKANLVQRVSPRTARTKTSQRNPVSKSKPHKQTKTMCHVHCTGKITGEAAKQSRSNTERELHETLNNFTQEFQDIHKLSKVIFCMPKVKLSSHLYHFKSLKIKGASK